MRSEHLRSQILFATRYSQLATFMIWLLRLLFSAVLAAMLWVTSWASLHQSLGDFAHSATIRDPWVVATLFDAYFGFLAVYVWMAWKETAAVARVLWFVAVILLGNLAIAAYFLRELFAVSAVPADQVTALRDVFTRRLPGRLVLPSALTAAAIGVYLLA